MDNATQKKKLECTTAELNAMRLVIEDYLSLSEEARDDVPDEAQELAAGMLQAILFLEFQEERS